MGLWLVEGSFAQVSKLRAHATNAAPEHTNAATWSPRCVGRKFRNLNQIKLCFVSFARTCVCV